jgi:hypothetical protein
VPSFKNKPVMHNLRPYILIVYVIQRFNPLSHSTYCYGLLFNFPEKWIWLNSVNVQFLWFNEFECSQLVCQRISTLPASSSYCYGLLFNFPEKWIWLNSVNVQFLWFNEFECSQLVCQRISTLQLVVHDQNDEIVG